MASPQLSIADFAAKIKAKYPDYAGIDDSELVSRIVKKYPDYAPMVQMNPQVSAKVTSGETEIPPPTIGETTADIGGNLALGAAKGIVSTGMGAVRMLHKIPGLRWMSDRITGPMTDEEMQEAQAKAGPQGTAQKIGFGAEQLGEFFVPGAAIGKGIKAINAGARLAAAVPKLAKYAPVAEYATRGALEAAPAVAIAKAQGQQDTGSVAAFAFAGPTFGKLLNKVGASKAATGAAKGVTGMVSKTIAEKIPEVQQSPRQMLWRALKPYVRNRDFDKSLDRAMPEIYEQAKMAGKKVTSVDDFLDLLQATKKRIWAPYAKMIGESADKISGVKIADALEASISDYHKTFSPKAVKQVKALADVYRKKGNITLSEAEDWLEVVNASIKSYYEKYPQARTAVQKASAMMKAKLTEAQELRATINQAIDDMGGVVSAVTEDPYSGKMFKQVYGGLQNLEQEAIRRVNVSKRLAPESLTEQMSKVHAAGEFAWAALRGHPLEGIAALAKGFAYKKAGEMIKQRNTSDYLISKAFQDFGDYVENAKKAHRVFQGAAAAANNRKSP